MRYRIVAVGKVTSAWLRDGIDHWATRTTRLAPTDVVEVKAHRGTVDEVQKGEGVALLARAEGYVVALDEHGRRFTTAQLADAVSRLELGGVSRITLLIGGAEGLSGEVLSRANAAWRLSDLTLPHELARLVLLEQLYRLESVRAGHPYHREGGRGVSASAS